MGTEQTAGDRLRAGVSHLTRAVVAWPALVAFVTLLLTAASGWYAVTSLGIDTSTTDMIDAEVPFRRHAEVFDAAFPQLSDQIVVVVKAPTPEGATRLARSLRDRLQAASATGGSIQRAEVAGDDPFFRRNGLLFLDLDALTDLADRLAAMAPFLTTLADDPTLPAFADLLALAVRDGPGYQAAEGQLANVLSAVSGVVRRQSTGVPGALSWQRLTDGNEEPAASGAMRLVLVNPVLDFASLAPAGAAMERIRAAAAPLLQSAEGARARLTGSAALEHEELESVEAAGKAAGLLSLTLVTFFLVVGLRSAVLIGAALTTLLVGLVWTAAFAALAVGHLNLISVAFAVLFVGLGVDFSIHHCLRYQEERSRAAPAHALAAASMGVAPALGLSALCAALGFLSFLPTDYRGLAELGVISAGGMAIALIANLVFLPALLTLFGGKVRGRRQEGVASFAFPRLPSRAVLVVAAVVGVAGAALVPFAQFDFDPMNLRDPQTESVAAFRDLMDENASEGYAADVLTPDLAAAVELAERLEALPSVASAVTLASLVPAEQDEKIEVVDQMAFFLAPALSAPPARATSTPQERAEAIERLRSELARVGADASSGLQGAAADLADALHALGVQPSATAELEERLLRHLPSLLENLAFALSAEPFAATDIPESVRRDWLAPDGRARVHVVPTDSLANPAEIRSFVDAVQSIAPEATGTPVIIAEAGKEVVAAFREATILASVLIAVVLAVVLRRAGDVLRVLAPLALAGILTTATAVLLGLPFNFANVIVLPLLLGLGVASGIHLVMRARRDAAVAGGVWEAVAESSTPRAVLFSALTTVASFGSLALSDHRGMMSMGLLLTIAIFFTLVATLIVLPALLQTRAVRLR